MDDKEFNKMNKGAARRAELEALTPIEFDELERRIKKWMLIEDKGVIKLLCATILGNGLPRDPIWIFLIGPSGGGKTELLMALSELREVYLLSLITPSTFLSGMPGKSDASLLPAVNGKVLIFKDWTSILVQNHEARNEIMGQLREIYEGRIIKHFGNGLKREWRGKIGLIAGVTQA